MCKAWVNFAKTGNPNHDGLPNWDPCTDEKETTMLFSSNSVTKVNYDDKLAKLHKELAPNPFGNKDKIVAE